MMKSIGKGRCGWREVEIEPTIEVIGRVVRICHDLGDRREYRLSFLFWVIVYSTLQTHTTDGGVGETRERGPKGNNKGGE